MRGVKTILSTPVYRDEPHPACREIVFSERAYKMLLAEAFANGEKETGGNFLGQRGDGVYYIVDSTLPGYDAVHEGCFFEMNPRYINYDCRGTARIYDQELQLLGFWHRHPGAFNRFSGNDDGMNVKYAQAVGEGTLSVLLNFVPEAQLTASYYDAAGHSYSPVEWRIDDALLREKGFLTLAGYTQLKRRAREMEKEMKRWA